MYFHRLCPGKGRSCTGRAQIGPQRPRQSRGAPRRMHCPFCRHGDSRVVDSRAADDGTAIRRRRQCPECGRRFTTVETASLTRDQALRGQRAVQPGQGARPASARPARAGRSTRTTWRCSPSGSRRRSAPAGSPRSRPTRSAWRSWRRCASSTRSPTCASPRLPGVRRPRGASRPRSPCSVRSTSSAPRAARTRDTPRSTPGGTRARRSFCRYQTC